MHASSAPTPRLFRLATWLGRPVDGAGLAVFRMAFGLILVWEATRYLGHGWLESHYAAPVFHFRYFGFSWVPIPPLLALELLMVGLGIMAFFVAIGFCHRASAALLCLGWTWIFLLDQARYLNHIYLVCMLAGLLAITPAHRCWSVDARRRRWRPAVPRWAYALLITQLAVVYVFGAIAKMNGDWIRGQPMESWLQAKADTPWIGSFLASHAGAVLLSWGGLLVDLLLVPALLWRRTRWLGVLVSLGFHLTNAWLFRIGIFPWAMLGATTLFFAPDWPRRMLARLRPATAPRAEGLAPTSLGPVPGWGLVLLACWLVWQVGMPLRHHAYPGDVTWTEEGHRFAWRMKLRTKRGRVHFVVRDPRTGAEETVDPATFLTPRQVRAMAARPDMILQAAHYLRDRMAPHLGHSPEVRARAWARLNDHASRWLVDPERDLARVPRSLAPADWIRPWTPEPRSPRVASTR